MSAKDAAFAVEYAARRGLRAFVLIAKDGISAIKEVNDHLGEVSGVKFTIDLDRSDPRAIDYVKGVAVGGLIGAAVGAGMGAAVRVAGPRLGLAIPGLGPLLAGGAVLGAVVGAIGGASMVHFRVVIRLVRVGPDRTEHVEMQFLPR